MANMRSSVHFLYVNLDDYTSSTPRLTGGSFALPIDENLQWDLISITYVSGTTPVADAGGVTLDVGKITGQGDPDTAAEFESIVSDFDLTGATDDAVAMVWRGRVSFVPHTISGATVTNTKQFLQWLVDTDGAITTPSIGASLTFEYEIMERSGV